MLTPRAKQKKQTVKNQSPSTFRLLDLPTELLIPIVRSYRSPIKERPDGLVIYGGEQDPERYQILRDLYLTNRDTIRSGGAVQEEYAGRTESIYLGSEVNADELMESGAYNPRELWSHTTAKFSAIIRFQNLRRLYVSKAQFDEVLALPNLATCAAYLWEFISIDAKAAFTSVNLPNLRRLIIFNCGSRPGSIGKYFDSIIPQLDHLSLSWFDVFDLERLLLLSTSLQSLHCLHQTSEYEGLAKAFDQIRRHDVKELNFKWLVVRGSSHNWETDFEAIAKFKKVVEGRDGLKRLRLEFIFEYISRRPSRDVCNRALVRWKGIKKELELICARTGIEVVTLICWFHHEKTGTMLWKE